MPTYLAFRTVGEISEEEIEAASYRVMESAEQMPGVRWIRSYYSAGEGKIYCQYEAPGVEAIMEHARKAGIPFDHAEAVRELEPGMFA